MQMKMKNVTGFEITRLPRTQQQIILFTGVEVGQANSGHYIFEYVGKGPPVDTLSVAIV